MLKVDERHRLQRRLVVWTYRSIRWSQRRIPPGLRLLAGILFFIGGIFGFLPVLGFWMMPLGLAIASTDIPPARRAMERWLGKTRKRLREEGKIIVANGLLERARVTSPVGNGQGEGTVPKGDSP